MNGSLHFLPSFVLQGFGAVVVVVVLGVVLGTLFLVPVRFFPLFACLHFLLSQHPSGHVLVTGLLSKFRDNFLQTGLMQRNRPRLVLFGIHLHLSSPPSTLLTTSEPCNFEKMSIYQYTSLFFLGKR